MGSMIPKEIKYSLHYDDVRGDFLRPPHGTTPANVSFYDYYVDVFNYLYVV